MPPWLRRVVKKGSKMRDRCSGRMPTPLSATLRVMTPGAV